MNISKLDPRQELSRKKYSAPTLQVYGDLAEITGTVGVTGLGDGVSVAPNKTH